MNLIQRVARWLAVVALAVVAACASDTKDARVDARELAASSTITMGEASIASSTIDYGNHDFLLAQQATLGQTASIQSLSFYVEAVGGDLELGVYDATGPGSGPGTLVAQTARFTPTTTGWNTQPVVTQRTLSAGSYWLAYLPSSDALSFRVMSSGSAKWGSVPSYGPMPNSFVSNPTSASAHWSFYATLLASGATGGPPPTVSASANPVTGTTVNLSVADQAGLSSPTFTWATTGTPPAPVQFSANGTNAAKNVTATFSAAGTYAFQVTLQDANGSSVTGGVNVTVQQTLSSLQVSPATASVAPSGTLQLSASGRDQFGNAMPAGTPTWSAGGGGTIASTGLLTAQNSAGGPFTITATTGQVSGTAQLTVVAMASTITIGETKQLTTPDSGNGGFLLAQQASLGQEAILQSMSFYVTTASGTLTLAVYDATGNQGGPGQLVAQTATFTPVTGWNTQPVITQKTLEPGTYWLSYAPSSDALGFVNQATGTAVWRSEAGSASPIPATFGAPSSGATSHWSLHATLIPTGPAPTPPPPLNTANLHFLGRIDNSDAAGPRFAWPGSGFVTRVHGTKVEVALGDAPGMLQFDPPEGSDVIAVFIDGSGPTTVTLDQTASAVYTLADNLADGDHDVAVYKQTETEIGTIQFLGFTQPTVATANPFAHKIEFIGDSITCGFGINIDVDPLCFFAASENAYLAYGPRTARALNASYALISWSGIGLFQNSDGTTANTLPMLYGRTLGDDPSTAWDFTSWIPDVVVINLGTNDAAGGTPGSNFVSTYEAFLKTVRGHYPNAFILATLGPMLTDPALSSMRTLIHQAIMGSGVSNVSFLEYPTQVASNGFGCDTHPSATTHALMSNALTTTLRGLTGW